MTPPNVNRPTKHIKKKHQSHESKFRFNLNSCIRRKDISGAISLYESAVSQGLLLSHHHFNSLLHLCTIPETLNSPNSTIALDYGFRVFDHMLSNGIPPTEATITEVSRLSAAKDDPGRAFELVKNMGSYGIMPRLRTYGPALYCYCKKLMTDEAYGVEEHMEEMGVKLEEPEVAALLRVSSETGRGDRVYSYLHKLRGIVRSVGEDTASVVEKWFKSGKAAEVGDRELDVRKIREKRQENGGGWHGMGWSGKGQWKVDRISVDQNGECRGCGERLVCVDIDCGETERFAQSVASLAMEREAKTNFKSFMDWIEGHIDYEAIVDAANIGLYQQNFAEGGFSMTQLDAVVRELHNRSQKWPLVVIHNKRLRRLQGNPSSQRLFNEWRSHDALYSTPNGSNDDWYWLYAAVRLKCLLVTNDEMRDHIFELLGSNIFLQWKERHQVHYSFLKGDLRLQMPPTYSIIIQESDNGSWHVPISSDSTDESSRRWLCITRTSEMETHPPTQMREERSLSPSE